MNKISITISILSFFIPIASFIFSIYVHNKSTEEKRQNQANHISAYILKNTNLKLTAHHPKNYLPVFFKVANASKLPIYEVLVIDTINSPEITLDSINNHNFTLSNPYTQIAFQRTLPPGETIGVLAGNGSGMLKTDSIIYFFKDSFGNRWFKSNYGKLFPIKNDDAYYMLINKLDIMASDLSAHDSFNSYLIR